MNYASNDPVAAGDYHDRHPIVLAQAPTALDVFPVGGALDEQSIAKHPAPSPQRYRAIRRRPDAILAPAGEPAATRGAIDEIRSALYADGLRGYVAVGLLSRSPTRRAPRRCGWCSRA